MSSGLLSHPTLTLFYSIVDLFNVLHGKAQAVDAIAYKDMCNAPGWNKEEAEEEKQARINKFHLDCS